VVVSPTVRRSPVRFRSDRRFDSRLRRDRRYAVRLHHVDRDDQLQLLRRLRGPSSWRCTPHAGPHPRSAREE